MKLKSNIEKKLRAVSVRENVMLFPLFDGTDGFVQFLGSSFCAINLT